MSLEADRPALFAFGPWRSPVQLFVLAYGVWFTVGNYVVGTIIWPSTITDPNAMHFKHVFGFIPVMINGWHLYFHLVTGLLCLWLSAKRRGAVSAGLLVGAAYLAIGALGLLVAGDILGFIMADTFGNWVHVAEGLGLVAVGLVGLRSRRLRRDGRHVSSAHA